MDANWTIFVSTVLPALYIALFLNFERTPTTESPSPEESWEREFNVLASYVKQNENTLLVSGSIFVTGAVILLGQTAVVTEGFSPIKDGLVIGSWAIYSIWLFFFQLFGVHLANRAHARLGGLEKQLKMSAFSYLGRNRNPIRRWVWLTLLDALLVIGSLLSNLTSASLAIIVSIEMVELLAAITGTAILQRREIIH